MHSALCIIVTSTVTKNVAASAGKPKIFTHRKIYLHPSKYEYGGLTRRGLSSSECETVTSRLSAMCHFASTGWKDSPIQSSSRSSKARLFHLDTRTYDG